MINGPGLSQVNEWAFFCDFAKFLGQDMLGNENGKEKNRTSFMTISQRG